jgi:hypothetical protein
MMPYQAQMSPRKNTFLGALARTPAGDPSRWKLTIETGASGKMRGLFLKKKKLIPDSFADDQHPGIGETGNTLPEN